MTSDNPKADWLRLEWWTVTRILVAGIALRVLWLLLCNNEPTSDQVSYHHAAQNLARGLGFIDDDGAPQGWWPVGYPAALTPFYWVLGLDARSGHVANVFFGAALISGVYMLARELFGARAGKLAALIAAFNPTFVLLTTVLATENLFVALAVWGSWTLVRAVHEPARQWQLCLLGGVVIGVSAYVRAPGLLLAGLFPVLALLSRMTLLRVVALSVLIGARGDRSARPLGHPHSACLWHVPAGLDERRIQPLDRKQSRVGGRMDALSAVAQGPGRQHSGA